MHRIRMSPLHAGGVAEHDSGGLRSSNLHHEFPGWTNVSLWYSRYATSSRRETFKARRHTDDRGRRPACQLDRTCWWSTRWL